MMLARINRSVRFLLGLPAPEIAANDRGVACYHRREFHAAIQAFDQGLVYNPYLMALWCNRGNAWYCLGDRQRALADYDEAIRVEPGIDAYYARGMIRAELGDKQAAIDDFTQALRIDHTSSLLYYCRGNLWIDLDRLDEAWADYDSALRLDPSLVGAWAMRGRTLDLLGQPDRALADYEEVFRRDDRSEAVAITYNNRGHLRHRQGRYREARGDFQEALTRWLAQWPPFPNPYKNLAWLEATCTDPAFRNGAAAVANALRAWELCKGQQPDWLEIVAAAHAEAGQWDEATRWQEQAVTQAPEARRAEQAARLELYRRREPYRDLTRQGLSERPLGNRAITGKPPARMAPVR
jgi:tetratricopeptide (TPR) repeat protein